MEEEQWGEEHGNCQECRDRDYQYNMTTLIYNGIIDQALRDEYDKWGRKDRTVENMVGMAVSRELSKGNAEAYANISNAAIHAVKSFHNKPNSMSNNRLENKCNKCGRPHDVGKYPAKGKTCHTCQRTGHYAKCCCITNRRQYYHQPSGFSGTKKTSTQQSNHKLRPVVKVHMVNEQGDCEGDAHWDVVENSIRPINYTDSTDIV